MKIWMEEKNSRKWNKITKRWISWHVVMDIRSLNVGGILTGGAVMREVKSVIRARTVPNIDHMSQNF